MKKGFTLTELLVVVLIIGILAAVALPQYTFTVEKARATEAVLAANAYINAQKRFYAQNDKYATQLKDLDIQYTAGLNHFDVTTSLGGAMAQYPVLVGLKPKGAAANDYEIIGFFDFPEYPEYKFRVACRSNIYNSKSEKFCKKYSGKAGETYKYDVARRIYFIDVN